MSPETRRTLEAELRKLSPQKQASLYRLLKSMSAARSVSDVSSTYKTYLPSPEIQESSRTLDVDEIEQRLSVLSPEAFELVVKVTNAELEARK